MEQKMGSWALALLSALALMHFSCTESPRSLDLIILGGTFIDGSGDAVLFSDTGISSLEVYLRK